jgi:hypothetical protein
MAVCSGSLAYQGTNKRARAFNLWSLGKRETADGSYDHCGSNSRIVDPNMAPWRRRMNLLAGAVGSSQSCVICRRSRDPSGFNQSSGTTRREADFRIALKYTERSRGGVSHHKMPLIS